MDFPTWFSAGCYGGLACCMFAIAVNALYTTLRRRGTTRQLAGAIVICVLSALLLLPAIVWYTVRLETQQATITTVEVEVLLVYVSLFGWLMPLAVTLTYCLFTLPRTSTASVRIPSQKRTTQADPAAPALALPKRQPGDPIPFVFDEDTPWGWLEHRNGRFQGQRLALKRAVVSIGRGEDNDIWLDDDLASRYHAELIWDQGHVYLADCNSLNGVLLNGRRIRGNAMIEPGELLEVGSHRFLFELARSPISLTGLDDPLLNHAPRPMAALTPGNEALPLTPPLVPGLSGDLDAGVPQALFNEESPPVGMWQDTAEVDQVSLSSAQPADLGGFVIRSGELVGRTFLLERPVLTIGRGAESDVVINDASISRRHAQVVRQPNGDYVQDLASRNGTRVNDEPLTAPRLLRQSDIVCLGNVQLEYIAVPAARTSPLSLMMTPPLIRPMHGPMPLRLPSRQREGS